MTPRCRSGLAVAIATIAMSGCTVVGTPTTRPEPRIRVVPVPETDPLATERYASLDPVRVFDEVRALWVVRYTMTSEEAVRTMIDDAERAGINTLLVQVRGRADAYYRSELEPLGEPVRGGDDFDPLQLTIEEAHRRGMAVHAWVNTHLVWGVSEAPKSPKHLVNAHPDWLAVPRELGREMAGVDPFQPRYLQTLVQYARDRPQTVEGVYTSPSHPDVQDRVHAVWMDLAMRYDLDGIHFDYIRFPSGEYDYSIGALERHPNDSPRSTRPTCRTSTHSWKVSPMHGPHSDGIR